MINNSEFIFVIGAPRSGTTWLQLLLSRHNGVLSNAENSLFSSYISHLNKVWEYEKNSKFNRGLPKFFPEMKFQEFLSQFINEAYSYFVPTIEGNELTKKIYLDKNPANVFHIELVLKFIPHAKFIHIIRDGRDVVSSMIEAKRKMGFGYDNVREAALQWSNRVRAAQKYQGQIFYYEVKYEDLLKSPIEEMKKIYNFLGWQIDIQEIQNNIEYNKFETVSKERRTINPTVKSGEFFYGKGKAGTWKNYFNVNEKYLIKVIAGDLLIELEYENKDDWWYKNSFEYYNTKIKFKLKKVLNG